MQGFEAICEKGLKKKDNDKHQDFECLEQVNQLQLEQAIQENYEPEKITTLNEETVVDDNDGDFKLNQKKI